MEELVMDVSNAPVVGSTAAKVTAFPPAIGVALTNRFATRVPVSATSRVALWSMSA